MIGIFGGSFDPPHAGHRKIILEFWKNFPKAKKLFIVPNQTSPLKEKKNASRLEILEMLKIFLDDICNQKNEICDFELKKKGKSYSIDTIKYMKKKFPNDKIYFLIGFDNLMNFNKWKEPEKILDYATLIVFRRKSLPFSSKILNETADEGNKFTKNHKKIILLKNKLINSSSSEIRSLLKQGNKTNGNSIRKLKNLLGNNLLNYILQKEIYFDKN